MARRTSLLLAAAVLSGIAGCSTANPATTRHISDVSNAVTGINTELSQPITSTTTPLTLNEPIAGQLPATSLTLPTTSLGEPLAAGMPVSTSPLIAGATAIPPLPALAGALPGALPPTAMGALELFPTLAFAPFRFIDLYTPLFATSFRVAAATLGLPAGLPLSIFSRLHFFGMHSYFGFYAPMYWWHGALQPLAMYDDLAANYTYPYLYSGPGGMAPFYYNSASLLSPYASAIGACATCAPGSALGITAPIAP